MLTLWPHRDTWAWTSHLDWTDGVFWYHQENFWNITDTVPDTKLCAYGVVIKP